MTALDARTRPPLGDLLWLVPLGVVVLLGSWFTNSDHDGATGTDPVLALLCAAVAVGSLVVALRAPLVGVIGTVAAVAALVAVPLQDGPIFLTLGAGAYLVATRRAVRRWLPWVAAGVAVVAVALVLRVLQDADLERSLWQVVAVSAVVSAGAAIGTVVRTRRHAALDRAHRAATEEQLRMAQDLHDGVGHGLAVVAMQAGVALHVLDRDPVAAREALEAIRATSREALDSLRTELSQLAGEPAARRPRPGLHDLPALVARVGAAGPSVAVTGPVPVVPEPVDGAAYAIVQEALTNVLRHASATAVEVTLERLDGDLHIVVSDDGRGGDVQAEGMGLRGMRERAAMLGGTVTAGPRPTGGFEVTAVLPVAESAR